MNDYVLAACVELEFILDGTERPINRPSEPVKRKEHYSGKKKRTTVKNNVITERRRRGKVKYLSETVEGKKHDKKLADEEGYQFPPGSKLWKDTGFQGYEPEKVTTFQLVQDTFRNRKDDYVDLVMETACGLHNFRVSQRLVAVV